MNDARQDESALRLPMTIDEIDAAWLTAALRISQPDVTVTRLNVQDVNNGTCTKVRISVEANGMDLPETLMLKGGFEPHSRDWDYMHALEVRGYRQIIPALDLPSPRCYFADFSPSQRQGIIVMEDLVASGARFCDPLHPEGLEATRSRLTTLAAFHARTWQSTKFEAGGSWEWLEDAITSVRDYSQSFLKPAVWDHYIGLPRGAAVSRLFQDAGWMQNALEQMCKLSAKSPHCVLHGDTHLGNLYFAADGTPGFFDSVPGYGPALSEVAYHIVCALDVADRRDWEVELVGHYIAELASHGVAAPSLDDAMSQYGVYLARAYMIFIINASAFQVESVNTAYTARISAAMLDHDTVGRLQAIG